jgi:predicted NUDIX family NTP pyrophosphohydrolase
MPVTSAGILLYRLTDGSLEVWIGRMGGPFWARKDDGAWSIPKGEYSVDEDPLAAARREFREEIGTAAPDVEYVKLGDFKQPSGKVITVFAAESDFVVEAIVSNTFELEWPPRSGKMRDFPEIDDARWYPVNVARLKVVKGQVQVVDALVEHVGL